MVSLFFHHLEMSESNTDTVVGALPTSTDITKVVEPETTPAKVKNTIDNVDKTIVGANTVSGPNRAVYNPTISPPMPYVIGLQRMDNDPYRYGTAIPSYVSPYPPSMQSAVQANGRLTYGNLVTEYSGPLHTVANVGLNSIYQDRVDLGYEYNVYGENPTDKVVSQRGNVEHYGQAPSRRREKYTLNPSRKEGMYAYDPFYGKDPTFYGSAEPFRERFTDEQKNTGLIVLVTIITICVVAVCFGLIAPVLRVRTDDYRLSGFNPKFFRNGPMRLSGGRSESEDIF